MDLTHNKIEILISQVQGYRHLYDPRDKKYKDRNMASMSWETIGNLLNRNGTEIKEKWRKLRESHIRCKRTKEKRSGSGADASPKWKFYAYMTVLQDYIKHCETETNFSCARQVLICIAEFTTKRLVVTQSRKSRICRRK